MRLNLGCSDALLPDHINVDSWRPPNATDENFQEVDLNVLPLPWADGSVEHIRMADILEHLSNKIGTMNEIHRVLKPGGTVEIIVPTTDGRGAWQDPTHVSFWNRNSFFYFEHGNPHLERFREAYGITARFKIAFEREETLQDGVTKLRIVLEAVKPAVGEERPCALCGRVGLTLRDGFGCIGSLTFCPSHSQEECHAYYKRVFPNGEPSSDDAPEEREQVKTGGFAFSIIHTSARPNEWRKVFEAWRDSAVGWDACEYILVMDERWGFTDQDMEDANKLIRPRGKVIWNTGRRCYVDGANLAAAASSGDVLIVNADDQYPCDKWDDELLEAISAGTLHSTIPPSQMDYVVSVSTNTPKEHERNIMVMPILSRERYDRFGWVFFPQYESMHADDDFTAMAKRDKCIIDARHLIFPHKHWINGQREKDEQDRAQNSEQAYNEGAKLFAARKRIGFAGIPPKVEAAHIDRWKPMIAFMLPGNTFSAAFLSAWTNLWGYLASGNKYNVTHLSAYTSNAGMTRAAMVRLIQTTDFGVPIDFLMWIDDDNTVTPEQFEMLMADLREHPEYDAVCGWTWCGSDDTVDVGHATVSCGQLQGLERTEDGKDVKFVHVKQIMPQEMYESKTDLIEIGYSGFPAVLMRYGLLEKAGKGAFNPYVDERCEYGFSGEDVPFFARAMIRSGARYAVDRRVKVPHYKRRAIEPVPTLEQIEDAIKRKNAAEMAMK